MACLDFFKSFSDVLGGAKPRYSHSCIIVTRRQQKRRRIPSDLVGQRQAYSHSLLSLSQSYMFVRVYFVGFLLLIVQKMGFRENNDLDG